MGTGSVKSSNPSRRPLTESGVDATQRRALNNAYGVGTRIGDKYRLVRALGEGGMATVWVAYNEALDIHIAIKFIRAELQEAVEGLDTRLLQEARAAARLGHPAIVRVLDFGKTAQGDPYIVMELLSGEDLSQALLRGTLEPLRAVRTLLPIADALATAHENKIVHRDLKPGNIFLARTGDARTQPKLVDFGIAKLELGNGDQRITEAGRAMGSPAYMSPEQARVLDVDCRSDVWSLCVVLYEALTGALPFDQPTYADLVAAILKQDPKPLAAHGVYEPELWEIIARGLQKAEACRRSRTGAGRTCASSAQPSRGGQSSAARATTSAAGACSALGSNDPRTRCGGFDPPSVPCRMSRTARARGHCQPSPHRRNVPRGFCARLRRSTRHRPSSTRHLPGPSWGSSRSPSW